MVHGVLLLLVGALIPFTLLFCNDLWPQLGWDPGRVSALVSLLSVAGALLGAVLVIRGAQPGRRLIPGLLSLLALAVCFGAALLAIVVPALGGQQLQRVIERPDQTVYVFRALENDFYRRTVIRVKRGSFYARVVATIPHASDELTVEEGSVTIHSRWDKRQSTYDFQTGQVRTSTSAPRSGR